MSLKIQFHFYATLKFAFSTKDNDITFRKKKRFPVRFRTRKCNKEVLGLNKKNIVFFQQKANLLKDTETRKRLAQKKPPRKHNDGNNNEK